MVGRFQVLLVVSVLMSVCSAGLAAPRIAVSAAGPTQAGTIEWQVAVAPDPTLFSETGAGFGGTLDVELGLELSSASMLRVLSDPEWHDIPGHNPFTGGATLGTQADAAVGVVFASLGSGLLTSDELVPMLTIETTATAATLSWGGHTHWPELPYEFVGGRITQAGVNFDALQGSVAWAPSISGDYNGNGLIEQSDLDLVLVNWGTSATPLPGGWSFDLPRGLIDQTELDPLLVNWGVGTAIAIASASVPEPSAAILLGACVLLAVLGWRTAGHA